MVYRDIGHIAAAALRIGHLFGGARARRMPLNQEEEEEEKERRKGKERKQRYKRTLSAAADCARTYICALRQSAISPAFFPAYYCLVQCFAVICGKTLPLLLWRLIWGIASCACARSTANWAIIAA